MSLLVLWSTPSLNLTPPPLNSFTHHEKINLKSFNRAGQSIQPIMVIGLVLSATTIIVDKTCNSNTILYVKLDVMLNVNSISKVYVSPIS